MLISNKKVHVYRNLRTRTWSMRQGGKVIAHPHLVVLDDVEFRVQPAGRAKVLREGRKNVHAYASGYVNNSVVVVDDKVFQPVFYSPYKGEHFATVETADNGSIYEQPAFGADCVVFDMNAPFRVMAKGIRR